MKKKKNEKNKRVQEGVGSDKNVIPAIQDKVKEYMEHNFKKGRRGGIIYLNPQQSFISMQKMTQIVKEEIKQEFNQSAMEKKFQEELKVDIEDKIGVLKITEDAKQQLLK